jgi:hypothetical protein
MSSNTLSVTYQSCTIIQKRKKSLDIDENTNKIKKKRLFTENKFFDSGSGTLRRWIYKVLSFCRAVKKEKGVCVCASVYQAKERIKEKEKLGKLRQNRIEYKEFKVSLTSKETRYLSDLVGIMLVCGPTRATKHVHGSAGLNVLS